MIIRLPILIFLIFHAIQTGAQTYVFAQLQGSPLNTAGWDLQGSATVTSVTTLGNSEILLTPALQNMSGSVFYTQPINLALCNQWIAEFDFRMFDGTAADGIAFCFLDVPPTGFVSGGGLGIPATANGLKVCFDTYLNCTGSVPKIEIRWGPGYNECNGQPTVENTGGNLSFLRSNSYNHAKITYNYGNIDVYVNDILWLSAFQQFNFSGYLGFTAATGSLTDNHSIKNVVIYTSMPPSEAGPDHTICSGDQVQIGTSSVAGYNYSWTPSTGLSATDIPDPLVTMINQGTAPVTYTYYVSTSFASVPGCASADSVKITVLPEPAFSISASSVAVCSGTTIHFNSTATNGGSNPAYQWYINGNPVSATGSTFSTSSLADGDVVTCQLFPDNGCAPVLSNAVNITITSQAMPAVNISPDASAICPGTLVNFTATAVNAGSPVNYQWMKNGAPVGTNNAFYSDATLVPGDQVYCIITSAASCTSTAPVSSDTLSIPVYAVPPVNLGNDTSFCQGSSVVLNAGSFASWQWNTGATTQQITVTSTGIYSVVATTSDGCESRDTLRVLNIFSLPVVNLGSSFAICQGGSVTLNAGNFLFYSWNTGSSASSINVSAPGTYSVTVTDQNGCSGSGSVTATGMLPPPSGFLPPDTSICSYGTQTITSTQSFTSYLWNTGATGNSIIAGQPGIYWLEVTDQAGCTGRDSIELVIRECLKGFYIPQAFTPDGDGRNDFFRPLVFGNIRSYRFSVYNRWGQQVFYSADPARGWNGKIGNDAQGSGVYVWICTFRLDGEPERTEKGTVLLIR